MVVAQGALVIDRSLIDELVARFANALFSISNCRQLAKDYAYAYSVGKIPTFAGCRNWPVVCFYIVF